MNIEDIDALKLNTKLKVNDLMIPIVEDFKSSEELSQKELKDKWQSFQDNMNMYLYEIVWNTLLDYGVKEPNKRNSDIKVKRIVLQHVPNTFKYEIGNYYYTVIKPIVDKKSN